MGAGPQPFTDLGHHERGGALDDWGAAGVRRVAGVWTRDLARAHRMADRREAGTVWVNTYRSMYPMSPREGFGRSGLGVEHGTEVIREYRG
ncbi:aldehyde dehydrogenase family protein [Marinactinospora rubrisoli]|uniref:Aldehyde dehydrogenase family protein n=1 Tax=Marinactinospora rubrisoli TaxID=2715399 RepID=A0ABW2KKC8_9ACTN